ncbi:HDIG domain-containing protein [Bariatricus massiliensis]|mgnify:CR=1 FL=1|uniref:HDIG domain-containing protein n=1 Tax=Bariatricus massiliensis TaxID=1745713 RepID=A0ABS8DMG7_9FIRM|nr:HDIG domain-containing metalloprotein [Bariatricus massiliensis]MCB7306199.1 HDIG domain-containing protein [Bariatricus massiliensis]MCB7376689.1 HDIG domain-containing protein [Bariatricus massiliensis]MCB7389374.1 HDIG domain-containing protein [Bariatricus massiliensis]MCB7413544.1 HDIG domain-containing protein [Bariatricus massiliensis]MCQ5255417.1 HDIG domain-containing protein [Bariatricus massiliensis]
MKNFRERAAKKLLELRRDWNEEFNDCIKDLASHPVVLRMKLYPHHGKTNCYQHCMHVAYYNYQWCRFLKLDARSAARGGMLHDLFLYDWHTHAKKTGDRFHGMTHPKEALKNAEKFFELNKTEKDIIRSHMWPVTLFTLPHTKEGWITTITDKYCGSCETSRRENVDTTRIRRDLSRVVERFSYLADIKR